MTKPTTPMPGPKASGKSTNLSLPLEIPTKPEDSDTKSFKQLEKEFVAEARGTFNELGKEVVSSKIREHQMLDESRREGGPSTVHEALKAMLDYSKIGIRALSKAVGVPRKRLLGQIEGRENMPPEILSKIYDVVKQKNPSLFEFEKSKSN